MIFGKPIPGETPIDDASGLKIGGITTRKQLNAVEAENVLQATVKYLAAKPTKKTAPFDIGWARRLHQEMFGAVWNWAGGLREKPVNIGVAPSQIEPRLYDLLANLPYWKDIPILEQAVMLHHQAVQIHPFQNGNGRWARMLANIWLKRHNHPITKWPEQTIGTASVIREEYLQAIREADEGDYGPLIELHKRYTTEP